MDFSEYVVMEDAARDRLDDLRRTAGIDQDHQIVDALRRREETAAECLIAAWGGRAFRLALGITRNAQDAEEAVQDAFCAVVRRIDTFRGDSAFRSWLYRVVVNAAYQKLRVRGGRRAEISLDGVLTYLDEEGRHGEPVTDWSASVDDPSRQTELRIALTAAIAQLPADYRTALLLHDVEGLSNPEIGEVLRISVPNVKSRVHRARLFLRERLGESVDRLGGGRHARDIATVPARAAWGT